MNALIGRNLRVFFRDRASVFFSLLSVFIIIGLYALFLGDAWAGSDIFRGAPGVRALMDTWIMAGLLAAVSVTSALGALGTMVEDKAHRIDMDFVSSPVSRRAIAAGYVFSAFLVGIAMSLLTALLAVVYIAARGGGFPAPDALLKAAGLILLSTFANTALMLFIVSFLKSSNAFATASTLVGTLIGFLAGIYMPIGQLPGAVQWIVKLVPASHAAALFRQALMEKPIALTFAGAPEETVRVFREMMGVRLYAGGSALSPAVHLLVLLGTGALFFGLSVLSLSRKRK